MQAIRNTLLGVLAVATLAAGSAACAREAQGEGGGDAADVLTRARVLERLIERNITPDVLTDQTSAHDALNGYVPIGMTVGEAEDAGELLDVEPVLVQHTQQPQAGFIAQQTIERGLRFHIY